MDKKKHPDVRPTIRLAHVDIDTLLRGEVRATSKLPRGELLALLAETAPEEGVVDVDDLTASPPPTAGKHVVRR